MIKKTYLSSKTPSNINLVLIPGGPGLSSLTLRSFDILSKKYNLIYIDFPGTNGNPYQGKKTHKELMTLLGESLDNITGDVYTIGHSYGGMYASDLFRYIELKGVICLGTPMSKRTLENATSNYLKCVNDALIEAESRWENEPNNSNFSNWLSKYNSLYFSENVLEIGRKLIRDDTVSAEFFLDNRRDISDQEVFEQISRWEGKKLLIGGERDGLISSSFLREDAALFNYDFFLIPYANHFLMLDDLSMLVKSIDNFITKEFR